MAIIPWNKYYSETLAVMLERFRDEQPSYRDSKITYAGRLDPMAEGLVLLLTDEDVHKKNIFLGYDKVYEVEFFTGVTTDTYDVLGKVLFDKGGEIGEKDLKDSIESLKYIRQQEYPPYSSKTVEGKPLWLWQREGNIGQISIPKRLVTIHDIQYLGFEEYSADVLKDLIIKNIKNVKGNFRQGEIIEDWSKYFVQSRKRFRVHRMCVSASSGSYMRSLVHLIGEGSQQGATTLKIKRTQLGSY